MHPILFILLLAVGAVVAAFAAVFILVPLFKGIGWVIRQVFRFVGGEISDLLRIIGAIITIPFLSLFTVGSVIVGRWSAASHFGRSIKDELVTMGAAIYRVVLGHPARLLCLTALTDGIENRLPNAIAEAPGRDKPGRRGGQFDGYTIVGSLPGGGSGGRLYVAEPDEMKRAAFTRRGLGAVEQVVIKSFSLSDGSSLPQIIRESRSLDAARDLGLVLEHDLSPDRFYYVMEYVPGESLTRVAQRMHAISGERGLRNEDLGAALGYIADLCRTLRTYHRGGLWHKDVKPDNVIVDGNRAHLVDLGLITHMRSAMTLTTHGTEYFRDPELVRMALKGVKVNEVDGARFDVYGVGAALYSVIENSFPAHGGLSQITKRCPETIRWIIRRAMTDYDKRYASMNDLLADVEAVRTAPDPFTLRPADLPSMRGGAAPVAEPTPDVALTGDPGAAPAQPNAATPDDRHGPRAPREVFASLHQAVGAAAADLKDHVRQRAEEARRRGGGPGPRKPRVTNWWTGSFDLDPVEAVQRRGAPAPRPAAPAARVIPVDSRAPAAEQLARARARRDAIRQRAHDRMAGRHGRPAGRAGRAGGGAARRPGRPNRDD
ncbi:MAG: serine/threonine protein kinase, partial [Phycisphaerales bacterium JB039]